MLKSPFCAVNIDLTWMSEEAGTDNSSPEKLKVVEVLAKFRNIAALRIVDTFSMEDNIITQLNKCFRNQECLRILKLDLNRSTPYIYDTTFDMPFRR